MPVQRVRSLRDRGGDRERLGERASLRGHKDAHRAVFANLQHRYATGALSRVDFRLASLNETNLLIEAAAEIAHGDDELPEAWKARLQDRLATAYNLGDDVDFGNSFQLLDQADMIFAAFGGHLDAVPKKTPATVPEIRKQLQFRLKHFARVLRMASSTRTGEATVP